MKRFERSDAEIQLSKQVVQTFRSAWDAKTQADAERADIARRDTPKTGCNGYPFSRMRRLEEKGSE